jgi:plastocyanin
MKQGKWFLATSLLAMALALTAVACGDDDDDDDDDAEDVATEAPAEETEAAGEEPAVGTSEVAIVDFAFEPAALEVAVGATVVWTNTGEAPHTATATDGAEFDSGTLDPGGVFEWEATAAGEVSYQCSIHPDMTGTITVS